MWKAILLCAFVGLTASEKVSYENYQLYSVLPRTEQDVDFLYNFLYKYYAANQFDFWETPIKRNLPVRIMIPSQNAGLFMATIASSMLSARLTNNVQKLINETDQKEDQSSSFDFTSFHTLEEIYKNLDDLAERYPDNVKIIVAGTTYEGRQIKGVKISFTTKKLGVFLEGGSNAREWMVPAIVMYIIHQLLTSKDIKIRNLAESNDWYIFPVFNPDGYVYTHTTDRMWVKTRKPTGNECIGSNLNKNWDYKWNTENVYVNPCSNGYPGPKPFSEVETSSMSKYIESIKDKFSIYFSFHCESDDVMYPPDTTVDDIYFDVIMRSIVNKRINKPQYMSTYSLNEYIKRFHDADAQNLLKLNNITSGSSVNYIKGIYDKPLILSYGLDNSAIYGFLQRSSLIVSTGNETIYSLLGMITEAKNYFYIHFWSIMNKGTNIHFWETEK